MAHEGNSFVEGSIGGWFAREERQAQLGLPSFGEKIAQSDQERGGVGEGQREAARTLHLGVFDKEKNVFFAVEHAIGEGDELHGQGFKVHSISCGAVGY
jgi:hypothetical protein